MIERYEYPSDAEIKICKGFSQLTYHQEKVPTSTCSLSVKDKPKCID
jgi:hypothetical protein